MTRSVLAQIFLKPGVGMKTKLGVKFEDENGLLMTVNLEWWLLNEREYVVTEARISWKRGKFTLQYDAGETSTPP